MRKADQRIGHQPTPVAFRQSAASWPLTELTSPAVYIRLIVANQADAPSSWYLV